MDSFAELTKTISESWIETRRFFQKRKDKGFSSAFRYLMVIAAVPVLVSIVAFFIGITVFVPFAGFGGLALLAAVGLYILILVSSFVNAFIMHLFVYLLGGRGYEKTYRVLVYANTPSMLLSWIPFINIIGFLWGIVNIIIGFTVVHKFSTGRAIAAILLPFVIAAVIALAVLAFFLIAMVSSTYV